MYYPYLRGRQYELIGLRELCENKLLSNVIPVIEPVKASSTLLTTIQTFKKYGKKFILIRNPGVGTFKKDLDYNQDYKEKFKDLLEDVHNIIVNGYIINSHLKKLSTYKDSMAFCFNLDHVQLYNELGYTFKSVFIPDSSSAKRKIKESLSFLN